MTNAINFVSDGTVVTTPWLKDVNDLTYTGASGIVGSATRTAVSKLADMVSVKDFGAVGNGVADDTAAINTAIAYELANKKGLVFPGGTYKVTSTVNFLGSAIRDVTFLALGKVTIINSGTGPVATLDSGSPTARADQIRMLGDWVFSGNAASTYALYTRGLCRSIVCARAVNVATAGFRVEWSVLTHYKLIQSDDVDTFTTIPAKALIVEESQPGNYTAACTFDVIFEIASTLAVDYVHGGLANVFTGTIENMARGFHQATTGEDAVISGVDFEGNSVYDVLVEGKGLTFTNVNSSSLGSSPNIALASTATQVKFNSCTYLRQVDIDAGVLGVSFSQCAFPDTGSIGVTGTGAGLAKFFDCYKVNTSRIVTSFIIDQVGTSGTWVPVVNSSGGGTQGATTTLVGTYNVIGKICYIQGTIAVAKGTLGAGSISVSGFPIGARNLANDFQYLPVGEWQNIALGAGYTTLSLRIAPGNSSALFIKSGVSVASAVVNLADFPATMSFSFSGVYETL